jgi:hypothetical protein
MSLNGQWITRFTGSHEGTLVIDLDDVGDRYEGTAIVWQDEAEAFNAMIRIRTPTKGNSQALDKIPVVIIDNSGVAVSPGALQNAKDAKGIIYPTTVDVKMSLKGTSLDVSWTTSIGTYGSAVATVPKTRAGKASDLKARRLNTWDGFKKAVNKLESKKYIFRGQESSEWRLRSSFYRAGRANLEKYLIQDIADLQKVFSGVSHHVFNLSDGTHYGAFLNLAQHHGYPTPLLDWTWSPYVAAYFALHKVSKQPVMPSNKRKVRILKFDLFAWNTTLSRADKLFPIWPNVSSLDALAFGNPRSIPQQSMSTSSNVDDIESHIKDMEVKTGRIYLEAFDLPVRERNNAMRELALMGITAGALFPGLDGACEGLKERNF